MNYKKGKVSVDLMSNLPFLVVKTVDFLHGFIF